MEKTSVISLPFLDLMGRIIIDVDTTFIFSPAQKAIDWTKLQKQSFALLTSSSHCLQLWGYHCLHMMSSGFLQLDNAAVSSNAPPEKGFIFGQIKELLVKTQEIVHMMLLDFR